MGRQTVPTQYRQSSVEPENFLEVGRQALPRQHHQGSVEPEMCLEVGRQAVPIQHHQGSVEPENFRTVSSEVSALLDDYETKSDPNRFHQCRLPG